MKLLAYLSQSQNPWFNQAIEQHFLESKLKNKAILLLWQNRKSINIGRDQNPWLACNTRHAHQNRVSIVRRQTPGGALYHDPGHTNFALIGRTEQQDSAAIKAILNQLLLSLHVNAIIDQHNEIISHDRKISNTASMSDNGNTLVHSTIRVSSNLSVVDEYMISDSNKPHLDIIDNYSNLCELNSSITHARIQQALIDASSHYFGTEAEINHININPLPPIEGLGEKLHYISSWDWNYGQSPNFSRQIEGHFSWGSVTLNILVMKGTIKQVRCISSQRFSSLFNTFSNRIAGYPYQAKSVMSVICTLLIDFSHSQAELLEFASWLERELA